MKREQFYAFKVRLFPENGDFRGPGPSAGSFFGCKPPKMRKIQFFLQILLIYANILQQKRSKQDLATSAKNDPIPPTPTRKLQ